MKNRHIQRSSVFGVFLFFICLSPSTYAQTRVQDYRPINANEFPVAKVGVTRESNTSWYTFNIIHEIPEWKAERLEERLILRYSGLQTIEIDAIKNTVKVEVLNTADVNTITSILYHFKYNGYEEL
jgi:hypothetical protein